MANPCNISTFKCAVCGSMRGESNGWFVEKKFVDGLITVRHMDRAEPPLSEGSLALCGKKCLFAAIEAEL